MALANIGYGFLGFLGIPAAVQCIETKTSRRIHDKQLTAVATLIGHSLLALANNRGSTILKTTSAFATIITTSAATVLGKPPFPSPYSQEAKQIRKAAIIAIAAGGICYSLLSQVFEENPHGNLLITQIFSAIISSMSKP